MEERAASRPAGGARRVVCLSAESADWLARIGAWDRVVGVTAYFDAPPDLPPKPRIAGFSTARLDALLQLDPDLVLGFSDVQADLAAELIRRGRSVWISNQRSLAQIRDMLELLARVVDRCAAAAPWLAEFDRRLTPVGAGTTGLAERSERPRVYFEEWPEPLVTGIGWVGELIERAGGEDLFAARRTAAGAAGRTVDPAEVLQGRPDLIVASWCGRPVDWDLVRRRPGWESLPAVRNGRLVEIDSTVLLQPGYRLLDGYEQLCQAIAGE